MKNKFLPKALNRDEILPLCIDTQFGASSTDMHWHDCAEIIYMMQGSARVFVNEGWYEIKKGDAAFIPPAEAHCCCCDDADAHRVVIGITEELVGGDGPERDHMHLPFRALGAMRRIFKGDEELSSLFVSLLSFGHSDTSGKLREQASVLLVYARMLEIWEGEGLSERAGRRSDTVREIEDFIRERYDEDITAAEVAAEMNISYSHMAKLLRAECGQSFGEILLSERIDAAKRLLLASDMSITEIGVGVGFTDASYFIKKFGERVGITPYKYRNESRILTIKAKT